MSKWNGSIKSTTTDGIDVIVQESGLAYRRPTYKWDVPCEEWKDDAACKGEDADLFVLQDADEVSEDDQHELIAWGLKICVACPVRQACLNNSNELDRYWSTRGGQPPEGLFPDGVEPTYRLANNRKGGFRPGEGPVRKPQEKCKRGHEDWSTDRRGKRYCATCKREGNRASWEKRKAKR